MIWFRAHASLNRLRQAIKQTQDVNLPAGDTDVIYVSTDDVKKQLKAKKEKFNGDGESDNGLYVGHKP